MPSLRKFIGAAFLTDLKRTLHIWRRNGGSTFTAFAVLTIGIGSTTTIFSVLSSMLIRPLPVRDSKEIVRISAVDRDNSELRLSMPDALDIKQQLHSVSSFAFYRRAIRNLADRSRPAMVHVLETDADLFRVLGLDMQQGRGFTSTANKPGQSCETVLSWPFWQGRFGGRPVTGHIIRLNEKPCVIAGVLPEKLDLPDKAELWVPAQLDLKAPDNGRRIQAWYALARANRDVTPAALQSELLTIAAGLSREYPDEDAGLRLRAVPLRKWLTAGVTPSILILFAAVIGVLLMACVNVANLLLAKASVRAREMSVRVAVGASRAKLFQQLMTESLALALAASVSGLLSAAIAVNVIRSWPDTHIPRPDDIVVDWRVVLFAIVAALITGILFGTLPAIRVSMTSLTGVLKQTSGRISESRRQQLVRQFLVTSETAIATLLLIASFLLLRSFGEISSLDPGFQTDHLLVAFLSLPLDRYEKDTMEFARLAQRVVRQLKSAAGIYSATFTTEVPFYGTGGSAPVQIEGRSPPIHEGDSPLVLDNDVSPSYRQTFRISLLEGRDLTPADDREESSAVLVNAAFARIFFPHEQPVGRRLRYNPTVNSNAPWQEIVGVIADTRQYEAGAPVQPEIYIPFARGFENFPAIVIRTHDNAAAHIRDVEAAVHQIDSEIPIFSPLTMEQIQSKSLGSRTFNTALLTAFAFVALLLASGGIFAVIAYSVSQRTSEIGVRMACGASQIDIVIMILRQGVMPAFAGIALGVAGAYFLNRYLSGLLYGVTPTDLTEFAGAILVLAVLSVLAALLPAFRAARVEPWVALHYE